MIEWSQVYAALGSFKVDGRRRQFYFGRDVDPTLRKALDWPIGRPSTKVRAGEGPCLWLSRA